MRDDDDKPKEDEVKDGETIPEEALVELLDVDEEEADPLMAAVEDEKPWE